MTTSTRRRESEPAASGCTAANVSVKAASHSVRSGQAHCTDGPRAPSRPPCRDAPVRPEYGRPVPARARPSPGGEGDPDEVIATVSAGLAAVLSHHRGSVTELLQQLTGEPVDADVQAQWSTPAGPDNPLGLDAGADMMHRTVLLRGRATGRAFVYAESSIAPARIPAPVRRRLEQSRDPIGRVLSEHALTAERELLPGPASADHADATITPQLAAAPVSRRYRILLGTGPAFAVDEWFLRPAAEALSRRSHV